MRAVVQRVSRAAVSIAGVERAVIERGLLALVGVEDADDGEDVEWLAGKLARLRIFPDAQGLMNRSLQDLGLTALVVSQFTLFAEIAKGNRPSFVRAARPPLAVPLYAALVARLAQHLGRAVPTGEFGADMQVALINDGPVTIVIDSKRRE